MTYEQKARQAIDSLTARPRTLPACEHCGGVALHAEDCLTLRPALLEVAAKPGAATLEEPLTLEQVKALHVARVLREKNWNKAHAAKALAIDRRTLYLMITRYGIEVPK